MMNNYFDNETEKPYDSLGKKGKWIELVTFFRLSLYSRSVPCGAKVILEKMTEENVSPLPSVSTISKILKEQCLTHGRAGYYEEDYDYSNSYQMKDII